MQRLASFVVRVTLRRAEEDVTCIAAACCAELVGDKLENHREYHRHLQRELLELLEMERSGREKEARGQARVLLQQTRAVVDASRAERAERARHSKT